MTAFSRLNTLLEEESSLIKKKAIKTKLAKEFNIKEDSKLSL